MQLQTLGWQDFFSSHFTPYQQQGFSAARVAVQYNRSYLIYAENGELNAEPTGKLRYQANGSDELPTVGDWVAIEPLQQEGKALIHAVLPRKTKFSRQAAGRATQEQIVATNIDTVFLVCGLDQDFNVRRLERYLFMVWQSGCNAVIVLNKADLADDLAVRQAQVEPVAMGLPVVATSACQHDGASGLCKYLTPGKTVAFIGSSGVGKSSLINCLLGYERQKIKSLSDDTGRGQHTTSARELLLLPCGSLIMDTPGMREIQLLGSEDALELTFEDIEKLAQQCYFRSCQHQSEDGCAVQQAIADGTLDPKRLTNYRKLQREIKHMHARSDIKAQLMEKQRWRKISKAARHFKKGMC
jgi:ribosome biogenesis GTPase